MAVQVGIRLLAAGALLLALAPSAKGAATVPDWMRSAAAEHLPSYPAETKAVVLMHETIYTVHEDGKAEVRVREVMKILRPQGRDFGEAGVAFNSDEKLNYLHVWSIGPDGHEYELKDKDLVEVGASASFELYSDQRAKVGRPPAIDPGAVMAFEYSQKVRPYSAEASWDFQRSIPVRRSIYVLQLPQGWEYKDFWFQHPKIAATEAGANRWQWQIENVPGINMEDVPLAPSAGAFEGRMAIAYFGSGKTRNSGDWHALGLYYDQLTHDRVTATPEMAAKAQELVAGKTDFADRVQAVAEFAQSQIRYVAIEIAIGGYQPHTAQDIYKNRYGDCKDKATLLKAMLASVGVNADYLLVDVYRGVIAPDVPSTQGNHMIAAIELPQGYQSERLHSVITATTGKRYLVFDPTWEFTPFGQLEPELQGSYGVLLAGADSQAIRLPVLQPTDNLLERNGRFQLQADGTLKGIVTEQRSGNMASYRRYLYSEKTEKEQREAVEHMLERDLPAFTVEIQKAENVKPLNSTLKVHYSLTVPHYAKPTGPLLLIRPRILGSDSQDLDQKPRTYPMDLDNTRVVRDTFEVELPPGYTVDELPDPVKLETDFASYSSHSEFKGSTVRYTREYTVKQIEIPANRYAELQRLNSSIEADERNSAVLKKGN
jgi:hypothetical protein